MMEIEQLWRLIDSHTTLLPEETILVSGALRRVVARAVRSQRDYPAFDYSAVDGYTLSEPLNGSWRIVGEIAACDTPPQRLDPGQAVRVLTGGSIPAGTFAVAMQENCMVMDVKVLITEPGQLSRGQHIRTRAGIASMGSTILSECDGIRPGMVSLLTSWGVGEVRVFQRPRVLHISTGSELLSPGEPLLPGKIPDTNGPMMEALLSQAGLPCDRLRIRDDFTALLHCAQGFQGNMLLISGGSGPGDHDHTQRALEKADFQTLGNRINRRPGKPLIFAVRGKQVAFGLPGNPLSHWLCYQAFVRRALARMQGLPPPSLDEAFCRNWESPPGDGRRTWTPARLVFSRGEALIEPLPWQHSGDIRPLLQADVLMLDELDPKTRLVNYLRP